MHATQQWRWVYDPDQQQLQIELEQGLVHTAPYKASRLVPLHALNAAFSTEDAANFQSFFDALDEHHRLSPQTILEAALNHTIYQKFGRPQMPQSWYFQTADVTPSYPLTVGTLVRLNSGLADVLCAICTTDGEFVECMVLADKFPLSDIKTLNQYDVIKVMPNRLQSAFADTHQQPDNLRQA
ncbi:cell division protein ZapC domain-containing protein [Pseudidiomarina gelatinasegens]|uniref:cell division protein ZapC domain-containing protein n=1 Tax=Pseudidiomarina gelatinasegens TaxID=2487740 RepID=UPI0013E3EBD6|nr:cell division protein ZapC domain-containing protein [Pseudidiomarina gelatinasegens]